VTINEEQYQYLLELRKAKIPTTVLVRLLLHEQMSKEVTPIQNGAMIMTKQQKPKVMPLLRPEQSQTIDLMTKEFADELKKKLSGIDNDDEEGIPSS
jgi:hypothetical protein